MKKLMMVIAMAVLVLPGMIFSTGCGKTETVLLQEAEEVLDEEEETEEQTEKEIKEQEIQQQIPAQIYVDICGAVVNPGVYEVPEGSRIFQVIELAGGFREDAAVLYVNQAQLLEDGCQVRIYTEKETEEMTKQETEPVGLVSGKKKEEIYSTEKVDLNRADKTMLMTLAGIGETRAEAILAYRKAKGRFSSIEELMQVEGIKEKTYEKLKAQVTVSGR